MMLRRPNGLWLDGARPWCRSYLTDHGLCGFRCITSVKTTSGGNLLVLKAIMVLPELVEILLRLLTLGISGGSELSLRLWLGVVERRY